MHKDIPQLDGKGLRQFGLILGGLLAAVFGLVLPKIWGLDLFPNWYWIGAGVLVTIWALIAPASMRGLYNGWMRVALVIGHVVNSIILAIVYFAVITPMGLAMRLMGKDPMRRALDREAKSYRQASKLAPKQHFERPF